MARSFACATSRRVELGALSYQQYGTFNSRPAAVLAAFQAPGSNSLEVARNIRATMEELSTRFPPGVAYRISLDTTRPVTAGIREIIETLAEAVLLVVLVVFVFLQSWRATLIPLLTVPVSLVGAFALFPLFGFSVNTLSLFGLVLAIGLVVDDAIVVVEAVEHHIERGLAPREATLEAMKQVQGPVIAIALILAAVFVPVAFMSGITGRLYQQFALTIAISVLISAFNALTLSPALSALLLRPRKPSTGVFSRLGAGFNRWFGRTTDGYISVNRRLVRKLVIPVILLGGVVAVTSSIGRKLPAGFIPDEDQGYAIIGIQLPDSASLQAHPRRDRSSQHHPVARGWHRDLQRRRRVQHLHANRGAVHRPRVCRSEAVGRARPRSDVDRDPGEPQQEVCRHSGRARDRGGATCHSRNQRGGWLQLDVAGSQRRQLRAARPERAAIRGRGAKAARARERAAELSPAVPQLFADVDKEKALKQGVAIFEIYNTLQAFLGGSYVNDFSRFGRQWRVFLQADAPTRMSPNDIGRFYVRNAKGDMVPLSSFVSIRSTTGPEYTVRFNLFRSVEIIGGPAAGYSSGQALDALEEVAHQTLPPEMGYAWNGLSYQEKVASGSTTRTLGLSLVFVFLILAALYESWSLPFSVLLSTPIAVLGAFLGLWSRHPDNNVYSQIGLVVLVGLTAKNAILIVEFAKEGVEQGKTLVVAALEGARLRLRPILMTSLAFIFGCLPLWSATGAGANARRVLGTAVVSGMLAATTLIGIFFIPSLFVLIERLRPKRRR